MKVLSGLEVGAVSGGQADFSGVTATVTSTEQIIGETPFLIEVLEAYVKGAANGWI